MLSSYITKSHRLGTLRRWATSLDVFRFCRAPRGYNDGGDRFLAALAFHGEDSFRALLRGLGLDTVEVSPFAQDPDPTKTYTSDDWREFPNRIPGLPHIEQPSHVEIGGDRCHLWALPDRLHLTVHGAPPNAYEVAEADFLRAQRIEAHVAPLADRVVDPPMAGPMCLSPKRYPKLWRTPKT